MLKFIVPKNAASIESVTKHIKGDSLPRVNSLIKHNYLSRDVVDYKTPKDMCIVSIIPVYSDEVKITNLGRIAIQDYLSQEKQDSVNMWLKNAWIPILVSVVTTLIVNWLPTMLL